MSSSLSRTLLRRASSTSSRGVREYSTNVVAKHNEKWRPLVERDVLEPLVFPRERPGIEYALNWSLVRLQITPYNDAFRNANTRQLLQRAYGKTTESKALSVDHVASKEYQKLVAFVPEDQTASSSWKSFSPTFNKRVQREIAYYLTHTPSIFVFDGDFGHKAVQLRVITDNGTSGLLLKNLILSPRPVCPKSFGYSALVFHAPGFQFTPESIVEEFDGPKPSDLGLQSDKFVLSNEKENRITVAGLSDSDLLLDSIVYVTSKAALANGSIVIPSDSIISKDGKVTLFINTTSNDEINVRRSALLKDASSDFTLYGAQHNVLSKDGLSRAWAGVRVTVKSDQLSKYALKQGDLVETMDGGRVTITSRLPAQANLVKSPSNIVFVVNDASLPEIGKITADTALTLLQQSASSSFPLTLNAQKLFQELTSNCQFYVVNSQKASKIVERMNGKMDGVSSVDQQVKSGVKKL